MSAAFGSPESIVIGGRRFTCDAESSCEISLSGYKTEKKANGDGTSRNLMTRKLGKIGSLSINNRMDNDDMAFLQDCANSMSDYTVSLTLVDGTVYGGEMHITDDLNFDMKEGTAEITLEGTVERF